MEPLKHECGVAMVRLRKPLAYYAEKYGTWRYGLNKLALLMEKQHNRGQEGAGIACVKTRAAQGEEFLYRERAEGSGGIEQCLQKAGNQIAAFSAEEQADVSFAEQHIPYAGELYMGHLRYSTTGKRGLSFVHPFMRRSNWRAKNMALCANFNLTNVDEVFEEIAAKGQHPRMVADTFILLEQLGHRLDRESERLFQQALAQGLKDREITAFIEANINLANVLKSAAPSWDGGYVVCGVTGSGEMMAMRDPWGIRPAFWYANDEVVALASERPVLQTSFDVSTQDINELLPGQALFVRNDGSFRIEEIIPPKGEPKQCSFERIYFSRGNDADIYRERKELGRQLVEPVLKAINGEISNTVFSYIPNTAEAAFYGLEQGFNDYLGEQKREELAQFFANPPSDPAVATQLLDSIITRRVRTEKVAWKDIKMRTFISDSASRSDMAAHVYDITYDILRPGRDNLVIIDDSIVRGTTLRESILRILDRLHPRRIVIVSSAPQVRYPDYYGIDMASMEEFIAFRAAVELITERGWWQRLQDIYQRCKAQEHLPKEQVENCVRCLYDGLTVDEISEKMVQMLRPPGVDTEIHFVYQSLEGLHRAIPNHKGDRFFSGHYPTPGGNKRVNQAFIRYFENKQNA
ncbi:MAG: amidophosphoribosyltransferase [Bacteroidaceae bacterium]|nr:amidophosphoribosyltransferase [Bacteroidaceae bacterium]